MTSPIVGIVQQQQQLGMSRKRIYDDNQRFFTGAAEGRAEALLLGISWLR
ncbi:unnamed protein product [Calypogeia fissa]